jgi:glycerophosphoryl diester phosphodiesterase
LHTSAATEETIAFWGGGEPGDYQALQVPADYGGVTVVTPDLVARAHDAGVAVHVWTINDPGRMRLLIDMGVDGVVTDEPTVLAGVLAS